MLTAGNNIIEELVEELRRLPLSGDYAVSQNRVYDFFSKRGYSCQRQYPVPYLSIRHQEEHLGHIDLLVHDPAHRHPDIAVEIDRTSPRARTLAKLLRLQDVVRIVILRGSGRPISAPPGIHYLLNLPVEGNSAPVSHEENQAPHRTPVETPQRGLTEASRIVLSLIAEGHTYGQILAINPALTYQHIFAAAQEALQLASAPRPRRIPSGISPQVRVRQAYPRAYDKWTDDEDERLRQLVREGKSTAEIATFLQRQPSAITSRLNKQAFAAKPQDISD